LIRPWRFFCRRRCLGVGQSKRRRRKEGARKGGVLLAGGENCSGLGRVVGHFVKNHKKNTKNKKSKRIRSEQVGNKKEELETDVVEEVEVSEVPEDLGNVDEISAVDEEQQPDVATLQEELADCKDRMLRLTADTENFKKRMTREKEKMAKYAGENILRELLTTADNLDRALEQGRSESDDAEKQLAALLEGIELTHKGLLTLLEKFEVKPLHVVGEAFNPDEMDALTMGNSEDVPNNHVLQEFAKGYRFKDRVLRHAQVVVSSGKKS